MHSLLICCSSKFTIIVFEPLIMDLKRRKKRGGPVSWRLLISTNLLCLQWNCWNDRTNGIFTWLRWREIRAQGGQVFHRRNSSPDTCRDDREYKSNCITPARQEATIVANHQRRTRRGGRENGDRDHYLAHDAKVSWRSGAGITSCSATAER